MLTLRFGFCSSSQPLLRSDGGGSGGGGVAGSSSTSAPGTSTSTHFNGGQTVLLTLVFPAALPCALPSCPSLCAVCHPLFLSTLSCPWAVTSAPACLLETVVLVQSLDSPASHLARVSPVVAAPSEEDPCPYPFASDGSFVPRPTSRGCIQCQEAGIPSKRAHYKDSQGRRACARHREGGPKISQRRSGP